MTRREALLRALLSEAQRIEDAVQAVYAGRRFGSATGAALDGEGRLVGQLRESRTDEQLRVWVEARKRANRSSGTVDEVLEVIGAVIGGTRTVALDEFPPAGFVVRVAGAAVSSALGRQLVGLVRAMRGAGIRAVLHHLTSSEATAFAFDGGTGAGFGDSSDPLTGGAFASALE